jgi:dolichol kinase
MKNMLNIIIDIVGLLSVISLFAIASYLHRNKLYTTWQLRTAFFWPELIVRYRDHTREHQGRTGIWYYVAIGSIILSLLSILCLFSLQVLIPLIKKIRGI